jgi:hypothetical protein
MEIVRERDQYDRILRRLITGGQEQGLICPDVDPRLTALGVMGMINSIHQWYRPSGGRNPQRIGAAYADLIIRALSCATETHKPGHLADT